jgi:hypothetical protein
MTRIVKVFTLEEKKGCKGDAQKRFHTWDEKDLKELLGLAVIKLYFPLSVFGA